MPRIKLLLSILFIFIGLGVATSRAVTFGSEIIEAGNDYPYVVSIWHDMDGSGDQDVNGQPDFACTGTLISEKVVLTAAHCISSSGRIYVKYGADQLDDKTGFIHVSAVWQNPRYSAKQSVNDVGLLLLEKSIAGAEVLSLKTSKQIESVILNKSSKLRIIGWGRDQNEKVASFLRTSTVSNVSSVLSKKSWWRNEVWLAVGKYIKGERVYSGICGGDSGGPLLATLSGKTYLVGVASFTFAEKCDTATPSVFSRLSYYIRDIEKGLIQLPINEVKQNRADPSVISEPRILGTVAIGETLTCDVGKWSANTTKITYYWSPDYIAGYDSVTRTIKVAENISYSEKRFTCTVIGENANGSIYRTVTLSQKPAPRLISGPALQDMPFKATAEKIKVSCVPGNYEFADSVKSEIWLRNDSNGVSSLYSIAPTVELDRLFFQKYGGLWISCKSIAKGQGGTTESLSNRFIAAFEAPIWKSNPVISGFDKFIPPIVNSKATCGGWSWENKVESEKITWSISNNGDTIELPNFSDTNSITLTQDFLDSYYAKYLVCSVTGTNYGGTVTGSTKALINLPALPVNPVANIETSIQVGALISSGATAKCALENSEATSFQSSYTWSIHDSNDYSSGNTRKSIIIGNGQKIVFTEEMIRIFDKQEVTIGSISCTATMTNATGSKTVVGHLGIKLPGRPPLKAGLVPILGSVQSPSYTGFAFQITNYDPSFTWEVQGVYASNWTIPYNSISLNGSGLVTVSGLPEGYYVKVYVVSSKIGYESASSQTSYLTCKTPVSDPYFMVCMR